MEKPQGFEKEYCELIYAGIDIGSVATKTVLIDKRKRILAFSRLSTLHDRLTSGQRALAAALETAGRSGSEIGFTVSTGYGRKAYTPAAKNLPEIICHAKGTYQLFPEVKTIIDIGGQDSKIIELAEKGNPSKFEMNDKCAAGTGRFLEVLTERIIGMRIEDAGPLALKSRNPCTLSSVCTIFAETEIVSYLSENRPTEDVISGMNRAIAKRVFSMGAAGIIRYDEPILFSGGVARNIGVVRALEEQLGKPLIVPEEPQITAALGAALFALAQNT